MRRFLAVSCGIALMAAAVPAFAAGCPGNPNALGTSRTLVVDPAEHLRLGTMQYSETLPLADHEVVLTFDDGPLPPYSSRVLDILAAECVKATYFLIGRMAHSFPETVRRIYNEGHTIGTHSQNHPLTFNKMPVAKVQQEVDDGIASVSAALGDPRALAPFFRIPGLMRADVAESYLASRSLVTWSADFPADDWFKRITASEITKRALSRLEAKGKGILLLHDIHPATVLALPTLLRELKARGYHIVQVVPSGPERPKTVTEPQQWVMHSKQGWPRTVSASDAAFRLPPSPERLGIGLGYPYGPRAIVSPAEKSGRFLMATAGQVLLPPVALWPLGGNALAPTEIALAPPESHRLDWFKTTPAGVLARDAIAWPQRPALRAAGKRMAAAKPRAPLKPVRRPVAASSRG
jgi:peptidoglycan/xylan/chitin deacetylase (PgdA/CDA1 family)